MVAMDQLTAYMLYSEMVRFLPESSPEGLICNNIIKYKHKEIAMYDKPPVSFFYFLVSLVIFTGSISLLVAAEKQVLPFNYFSKTSDTRDVKISPDGKHLVVIFKKKGREVFGILEIPSNEIVRYVGASDPGGSISEVFWVSNTRLVYSTYEQTGYDQEINQTGELSAINIDGSKHKLIFGFGAAEETVGSHLKKNKASRASHKILDLLPESDKHILIAYYPWKVIDRSWRINPYAHTRIKKLNVYTGKMSNVDTLPISLATAITDNSGAVRFAIGTDKKDKFVVFFKENPKSKWQEFSLDNFEGKTVLPFSFTQDNKNVYMAANVGDGTRALYRLNLIDRTTEKLFHDESIDVSRIELDFTDRRAIYVTTERALPKYHYVEPSNKKAKLHKLLMKAFEGQDVIITSTTKDTGKVVVLVYADNNPGDYYLFDTKTLNAQLLMSRSSWIFPEDLVKTESISITTRDQQEISGYLTRPRKMNKEKLLPMVVFPHGGPHGIRDEWGYNSKVQLFANRGYAVLQVNFRGSGGFGTKFQTVGHGKWGTLMQDDITDATNAMIKRNIADPNRICIYGGSYGGYAALMGAVREPDLYKCAIGSAGIYDLPLWLEKGDIANYLKNGMNYLTRAVGDNVEDLQRRSPAFNVDKIKANVLLIHGTKDERVPIEQAHRLMEEFDKINKDYQWLEFKYEGHSYRNNQNREKAYRAIIKFLDENIGT